MRKSLTTKIFTQRSYAIHGDTYDYSNTVYTTIRNKVSIICKKHGLFKQLPHDHMKGIGCIKCCTLSTEDFIFKAKKLHGEIYDYSKVKYTGTHKKVTIVCSIHGEFQQVLSAHTSKKKTGCPNCGHERSGGHVKFGYKQHVYLVEMHNDTEKFYKVGVSNQKIQTRLNKYAIKPYKLNLLAITSLIPSDVAYGLEQSVLDNFKSQQYRPEYKFDGYTECLMLNNNNVEQIINRINTL